MLHGEKVVAALAVINGERDKIQRRHIYRLRVAR
jgi:hypothetical protein